MTKPHRGRGRSQRLAFATREMTRSRPFASFHEPISQAHAPCHGRRPSSVSTRGRPLAPLHHQIIARRGWNQGLRKDLGSGGGGETFAAPHFSISMEIVRSFWRNSSSSSLTSCSVSCHLAAA